MDFSEFVKTFEKEYEQDYEYEIDETAESILLCAKPKQLLLFDVVRIEFEGDTFSIYKEFVYEDYASKFRAYLLCKEDLVFREALNRLSSGKVQDSFDDGMGCPFSTNQVGFLIFLFHGMNYQQR